MCLPNIDDHSFSQIQKLIHGEIKTLNTCLNFIIVYGAIFI